MQRAVSISVAVTLFSAGIGVFVFLCFGSLWQARAVAPSGVFSNEYDAVIVAVPHEPYLCLDENYFAGITKPHGLIADLKGLYRNKIINRNYWSL